jgi:hypothetical protein
LNDAAKVRKLFDALGVPTRRTEIIFGGRKNRSIGYPERVAGETEAGCDAVLEKLPRRYLEIFQREPYVKFPWNERFQQAKREPAACGR